MINIFARVAFLLFTIFWLTTCSDINNSAMIHQMPDGHFLIKHRDVSFEIDPALGARIVSARIDDSELLLQERNNLVNWGSTFWLAPQKLWKWPPPLAIHEEKYEAEIDGDHLQMISDIDQKFGVRAIKVFQFNDDRNSLEIHYKVVNETDSAVQYGPWEVTVVPAIGSSVCFALGDEPKGTNSNLAFENHDGIGWFSYDDVKSKRWHKTFNNAAEGWLAHINSDEKLFVKKFELIPAEEIAEGQGNVEIYVSKEMKYIELENHGRYTHLEPGASMTYKVSWFLTELPPNLSSDGYSEALIRLIRKL